MKRAVVLLAVFLVLSAILPSPASAGGNWHGGGWWWPGALVGWLALVSPAFLSVPLLAVVRRWLHLTRMRSAVDAVVIGGATLLVPSAIVLLRDGLAQLASLSGG